MDVKKLFNMRLKLYNILWIKNGENFCFYCNNIIYRKDRTLDHLTPKSRGGSWHISNIVLAHRACNWAKADMTLFEFNEFVKENGGIDAVVDKYGKGSHSRINT